MNNFDGKKAKNMAKFSERVDLRVTPEMYAVLLSEAGGDPRRVPDVVRKKLVSSLLNLDDVRLLKAQQAMTLALLKELFLDQAPVLSRMRGIVDGLGEEKKLAERLRFEEIFCDRMGRIERLRRDHGL